MDKRTAQILSVIFHPLIMPTLLFAVLWLVAPAITAPYSSLQVLFILFISSFLIPLLFVGLLYRTGLVESFTMDDKGERAIPFAFTAILYWMVSYMFYNQFRANNTIIIVLISVSAVISFIAVVNFFWKISAHSAGIMGVIGYLAAISIKYPELPLFYPLVIILILSGFVMSARLTLQIHNLPQIVAGGVLGFVFSFISLFFLG